MSDSAEKRSALPRGKVGLRQEKTLEKEREFLLKELDCRLLIPRLRGKGVLDGEDINYILETDDVEEQNRRLLGIIQNSTPAGFESFLSVLRMPDTCQVYNTLVKALRSLEESSDNDMMQPSMRCLPRPSSLVSSPLPTTRVHTPAVDGNNCHTRIDRMEGLVENHEDRLGKLEDVDKLELDMQHNQEEIDRLTHELNKTKEEVKRIEEEKEEMQEEFENSIDRLSETLRKTTAELEEKNKIIACLEEQIEKLERDNRRLADELDRLKAKVKKEREQVRSEMQRMKTSLDNGDKELKKIKKEKDQDKKEMQAKMDQMKTEMQAAVEENTKAIMKELQGTFEVLYKQGRQHYGRNSMTGRFRQTNKNKSSSSSSSDSKTGEMSIKGKGVYSNKYNSKTLYTDD